MVTNPNRSQRTPSITCRADRATRHPICRVPWVGHPQYLLSRAVHLQFMGWNAVSYRDVASMHTHRARDACALSRRRASPPDARCTGASVLEKADFMSGRASMLMHALAPIMDAKRRIPRLPYMVRGRAAASQGRTCVSVRAVHVLRSYRAIVAKH